MTTKVPQQSDEQVDTDRQITIRLAIMLAHGAPVWQSQSITPDRLTVSLDLHTAADANRWAKLLGRTEPLYVLPIAANRKDYHFGNASLAGWDINMSVHEPWPVPAPVDVDAAAILDAALKAEPDGADPDVMAIQNFAAAEVLPAPAGGAA